VADLDGTKNFREKLEFSYVKDSFISDLDQNGWPEVGVHLQRLSSFGANESGTFRFFQVKKGKLKEIPFTPLVELKALVAASRTLRTKRGTPGRDFFVHHVGRRLYQEFYFLKEGDGFCCPTGGMGLVEYALEDAGFVEKSKQHLPSVRHWLSPAPWEIPDNQALQQMAERTGLQDATALKVLRVMEFGKYIPNAKRPRKDVLVSCCAWTLREAEMSLEELQERLETKGHELHLSQTKGIALKSLPHIFDPSLPAVPQGAQDTFWKSTRYFGQVVKGKPHGYGIHFKGQFERYNGEWENGEHHGTGTNFDDSGDIYSGEWMRGMSHGQGKRTWGGTETGG
jgi:hypothetical protein